MTADVAGPVGVLVPVLLAGGSGTRLWPVSREAMPKHLVRLIGEDSLLQRTARRALRVAPAGRVITVGATIQSFLIHEQLCAIDAGLASHLLLEPVGRNTAAAVALAALVAAAEFGPDAVLWVCPSDHMIGDEDALLAALGAGLAAARRGELVTFGIRPAWAETGYGYIRTGEALDGLPGVLRAAAFVEKPDAGRLAAMLAEGGHLWNSGMFLLRADRLLEELARHAPLVLEAVRAAHAALAPAPQGALAPPAELFAQVPSLPLDKAVMERSERVAVVPCDPGWSDVGSWQALWQQLPHDAAGNAVRGAVVVLDSRDCLVHAEHRLVAVAGLDDVAVVETRDAVLVARKQPGDGIRALVAALRTAGRPEATAHAWEVRPWGRFTVLHEGTGFKVKELVVHPGARLSLQSHRHRAEHWVVVAGTAEALVDDQVHRLDPDQGVHIPQGARHRLANPGGVPMHLIEVQCGSYFGEDDITRYDDVYGRI